MTSETSQFLPNSRIEIINPKIVKGQCRAVLFDFDGTSRWCGKGGPRS
jgi:trehalose-6-phosphatase